MVYTEIGIGNKIVKSHFDWIDDSIELMTLYKLLLINNKNFLMNKYDTLKVIVIIGFK